MLQKFEERGISSEQATEQDKKSEAEECPPLPTPPGVQPRRKRAIRYRPHDMQVSHLPDSETVRLVMQRYPLIPAGESLGVSDTYDSPGPFRCSTAVVELSSMLARGPRNDTRDAHESVLTSE